MVFSSFLFLFYFLPVALLLYYAVPRRPQHLILTLLSFVFYGWANPLFSFLLLLLHAHRLHRRAGDRARRPESLVAPDRTARPERSEGPAPTRSDGRLDLREPYAAGLLQVLQLRHQQLQRSRGLARRARRRPRRDAARRAAARYQPVHPSVAELRHRRLSRPFDRNEELQRFSLLRDDVPAAGRRADHPLLGN